MRRILVCVYIVSYHIVVKDLQFNKRSVVEKDGEIIPPRSLPIPRRRCR